MIPREDAYGWGVCSIPIARELGAESSSALPPGQQAAGLAGLVARDTPWRALLFSVLMTCLVFSSLLLLGRGRPAPLLRPEPAPVEIAVLLREEPRPLPAPAVVTVPTPVPAPPRPQAAPQVVRPAPAPPPDPPVVRKAPVAPPAPPVVRPPPTAAPLPQPTRVAPPLPERLADARSTLPKRKAEMALRKEAALPVAPSLAAYQQTPRSEAAAALPKQAATFSSDVPVADLAVQPAPGRIAERKPARQPLPKAASAALGRPAGAELNAVDTGLSQTRHATPSAAPAMPTAVRRQSVSTGGGAETAIVSPQATGVGADLGKRVTSPAATLDRAPAAFAGSGAEESLSGPAATVIPKGTASASALPAGGSFDFLDLVTPSELDRSVLVSLNRLSTCRDPEAETRLKTRLAALLSQPARCRAGGVIFAIRNPESAYSIHVDLYNYEQREFQDRCEALRLAVQACEARR